MNHPPQTPPPSTKIRNRDLSKLALGIVGLFFLNLLAQQFFFRINLTEEQRYSISAATKALLRNLDQDVAVTVYLEGDGLPPDFRRLQRSVRETLNEFQVYADGRLTYRFVNPLTTTSAEQRQAFIAGTGAGGHTAQSGVCRRRRTAHSEDGATGSDRGDR